MRLCLCTVMMRCLHATPHRYGLALTSQSLFAYVMVAGMSSYLAGRSQAHRAWYLRTLPAYPQERKALVPFLF